MKVGLATALVMLGFTGLLSAVEAIGWTSVPSDSSLEFFGRYEDIELTGSFRKFTVRLELDNDGQPGSLRVLVDTATVEMNDSDINAELRKPDWFSASDNGNATFQSSRIEETRPGAFIAHGMLELKGIAKPAKVPFQWRQDATGVTVSGELGLSRLQWNIGVGEWADTSLIADEVAVRFRVRLELGD